MVDSKVIMTQVFLAANNNGETSTATPTITDLAPLVEWYEALVGDILCTGDVQTSSCEALDL